jgi:DNA-binding transcriptional LysR family regulator
LTRLIPTDGSWPKSFARKKLNYDITIRARFGTTVCAPVKAGLGIAVIDQFTVAHGGLPGIELLRIVEPTKFDTYLAVKRGAPLSLYTEHFVHCLRLEMQAGGLGATEGCLAGLQKNSMLCYQHICAI